MLEKRLWMVKTQIESRGIRDAALLKAMREVPRHQFVPDGQIGEAYTDQPLPIGFEQTISQPYIVALMTELADLKAGERVLEIGTGSGYQAAVLRSIVREVYSIEYIPGLAEQAKRNLTQNDYSVHLRAGDGFLGWPDAAPFDAILVTAAAPKVPELLIEQLAEGGRLVIPVGEEYQQLFVFEKRGKEVKQESIAPVRFVPMVGKIQE